MESELEQRNYFNWAGGKRKEAIGVIIIIPKKYKEILDKLQVAFINKDFFDE
jgi:hypothetical protein